MEVLSASGVYRGGKMSGIGVKLNWKLTDFFWIYLDRSRPAGSEARGEGRERDI